VAQYGGMAHRDQQVDYRRTLDHTLVMQTGQPQQSLRQHRMSLLFRVQISASEQQMIFLAAAQPEPQISAGKRVHPVRSLVL
jgi:hypothetical protein